MRGCRLALAALLCFATSPAFAQGEGGDIEMGAEGEAPAESEPPAVVKDPKLAKKLQQAAVKATQQGDYAARRNKADDAKAHYETAATAYTKAIETGDDKNLYYDLALVEAKLGKLDLAVKHLQIVIKPDAGTKPDVVKKATTKFDELSMQVGFVTLEVDPEATTVSIAGAEVGTSPLAEPLVLMPGTYTLTFASDGYQPKDVELVVEAGSETERKIELEPIKIVVAPVSERPVEEEPVVTPPAPSKLPLYVGAGVTGAALVTTVITGIMAVGEHDTFTAEDSTRRERDDAQAAGKNLALVSDIALGTTIVAAGFTAYWYFAKYKPAQRKYAETRPSDATAKVHVVPWVQPATGGLSFAGSF